MAEDYVNQDSVAMTLDSGREIQLLWGDLLREVTVDGDKARVRARGRRGTIPASALGGKSLLEFYFIDVGQGDGVLIKTPDSRHVLIDAGFKRASQPTGKNAADFVDWKFVKDYGKQFIELDAMIASHNDADHYGGLWDLLDPSHTSQEELDADGVGVENFYHAGVAWWKDDEHSRWLGSYQKVDGEIYLTQLMEDRPFVLGALDNNAGAKLQGEWAKFMNCVVSTIKKDGTPTQIQRLSHLQGYLPTFNKNNPANGTVSIRVLGPIEYDISGASRLRYLHPSVNKTGDSKTTNGNSVLLRVDYGKVRVLLTGDLNTVSQHAIMKAFEDEWDKFECDVAKGCHHGSDDVSYKFLSLMKPAVSILSSGDAEGHDHPRPSIVGASAVTGFLQLADGGDKLISPLIYSTEIARSLGLGKPDTMSIFNGTPQPQLVTGAVLDNTQVECRQVNAGALQPTIKKLKLNDQSRIVTDLVYGLVNVRTDGDRILCATLNENNYEWEIKTLRSRF